MWQKKCQKEEYLKFKKESNKKEGGATQSGGHIPSNKYLLT